MAILDTISQIPIHILNPYAYIIIFLMTTVESIPILGFFVPGSVAVIIGGFLAKLGILDMGYLLIFAILGAVIGDVISYKIGEKYGMKFITQYGKHVFIKKPHIDKTRRLINKHSGKTLIIGRFSYVTRAITPFVAGASKMKFSKFMAYNIIGAIPWVILYATIGYIFGASFEIASRSIGRFIFLGIVLSICIIYIYRLINRKRNIFEKYQIYTLILNILSIIIFFNMLEDVVEKDFIAQLDTWINVNIVHIWNPILNKIMISITNIGGPIILTILTASVLYYMIKNKKKDKAIYLIIIMGFGLMLSGIIKLIVHRARPINSLVAESTYSFPSGHATMAIIFFSMMVYIFKDEIKNKFYKSIFIAANIILFSLVGLSRIYLNTHWFSDVIGGFALGLFIVTISILVSKIINYFFPIQQNRNTKNHLLIK